MKKLLLIEDDQIVANIYRNKFTIEGFQVEIALDGQVGFDLVRSFKPDVILLDLLLPKMTGVELMKKIRAEPEFETLPIIVFSNTYLTNLVQDAWKAGATKCIARCRQMARSLPARFPRPPLHICPRPRNAQTIKQSRSNPKTTPNFNASFVNPSSIASLPLSALCAGCCRE